MAANSVEEQHALQQDTAEVVQLQRECNEFE